MERLSPLFPIQRALRWAIRAALLRYVRAESTAENGRQADKVFILLVSAWGMGGTIRAAHNLAGYLADHHEVEIISAYRRREKPAMGHMPAGVTVTALDDQRASAAPNGLAGLARRLLRSRRSVFINPHDRRVDDFSLWTDVQLVRRLRGQSGILIGTRPALNLLAAQLALPGMITIGQEQMHLASHGRRLRRAMPRHYPRLDALVVLTERDREAYRALLGRARVERIPNTVRPTGGAPADLAAKTVFAAGRYTYQKGFDLLITAWAQVHGAHPDWRLKICGQGVSKQELKDLIAEHGLSEVVELAGRSSRLGAEMARHSIFVLSSRYEGFPLVLLEAMSKAMGIVAFDCPTGPGEIVDDHRNGILVPAEDVDRLAAGIIELIGDEPLRRRCAAAAAKTSEAYTIESVGRQWDELFAQLLRERADRPTEPSAAPAPARVGAGA